MVTRHQQHVALEDRTGVEEPDDVLGLEHDLRVDVAGDDRAEEAVPHCPAGQAWERLLPDMPSAAPTSRKATTIATIAPMMFSSVNLPVPRAVATTPPTSDPTTPSARVDRLDGLALRARDGRALVPGGTDRHRLRTAPGDCDLPGVARGRGELIALESYRYAPYPTAAERKGRGPFRTGMRRLAGNRRRPYPQDELAERRAARGGH